MYIFWVNLITFPQAPKFLFGGHLETSFCGDTWRHHTSPRYKYRFGAMSWLTLKINEQNGRCVRKGWVQGIEVTIAHTRSGGAPEPKLEKDLWLRGIPSTWSSQGFHGLRLRRTRTSRGSWKKKLPTQKNTETDLLFFSEKIHRPKIFEITISCYMCLV